MSTNATIKTSFVIQPNKSGRDKSLFRVTSQGRAVMEQRLFGAREENRTPDLRITSALLYRLSYPGNGWKSYRLRAV